MEIGQTDCQDFYSNLMSTFKNYFLFLLANIVAKEQSESLSTLYQPDKDHWPDANPLPALEEQETTFSFSLLEILGEGSLHFVWGREQTGISHHKYASNTNKRYSNHAGQHYNRRP